MSLFELFSLLGGVGLFLYGMTIMSTGLKNACGENLRVILEHATKNKVISVVVGIAITMLIQSSSATDVMVIGFVNSGLMSLTQAIGVIMGANIGTTITAQITAFNLSAYAPMILFVGAVMYLFVKKDMVKYIGSVIMGFGMLFEGIALMKAAIAPLAETEAFINMISALENPFLIVLFGVLFQCFFSKLHFFPEKGKCIFILRVGVEVKVHFNNSKADLINPCEQLFTGWHLRHHRHSPPPFPQNGLQSSGNKVPFFNAAERS